MIVKSIKSQTLLLVLLFLNGHFCECRGNRNLILRQINAKFIAIKIPHSQSTFNKHWCIINGLKSIFYLKCLKSDPIVLFKYYHIQQTRLYIPFGCLHLQYKCQKPTFIVQTKNVPQRSPALMGKFGEGIHGDSEAHQQEVGLIRSRSLGNLTWHSVSLSRVLAFIFASWSL